MEDKTGGAAFPGWHQQGQSSMSVWSDGMTLLDYFAIKIYVKLMERYLNPGYSESAAQDEAWRQAQAMLEEKRRGE